MGQGTFREKAWGVLDEGVMTLWIVKLHSLGV